MTSFDDLMNLARAGAVRVIEWTPDENGVMHKACYDPRTGEVYDEYRDSTPEEKE